MKKRTLLSLASIATVAAVSLALSGCGDGTPAAQKVTAKPVDSNQGLKAPAPPNMAGHIDKPADDK